MSINKGNFIELHYTGKLLDGSIFDTTDETIAKEAGIHSPTTKFGPAIICVGERQLLVGLDDGLVGKIFGKHTIELSAEHAFGKRDVKKVKIVPAGQFKEHNLQPQPGLQVNVDGEVGIITRVAGGRVIVNFNHPLAGKNVVYDVEILRKVTDPKEQITTFLETTMRLQKGSLNVEINDKNASVELPMQLPPAFVQSLQDKMNQLIDVEITLTSKKEYINSASSIK